MFHLFSLNVYNEWLQSSHSDYETQVRITAWFSLEGDTLILLPSQFLWGEFGRYTNSSLVILAVVPAYLFKLLIRPPPETVRTSQSSCRINHRLLNQPICARSGPYSGIHEYEGTHIMQLHLQSEQSFDAGGPKIVHYFFSFLFFGQSFFY